MLKKIKSIALLFFFIVPIILTGCDLGLGIKSIAVETYPDKIIYVAGYDKSLDLTGGKIRQYLVDANIDDLIDMSSELDFDVIQNIDFAKPGVYEVIISKSEVLYCSFAIQVVDKNYIQNIMNKETDSIL